LPSGSGRLGRAGHHREASPDPTLTAKNDATLAVNDVDNCCTPAQHDEQRPTTMGLQHAVSEGGLVMAELDVQATQAFARRLLEVFTGSALTKLVSLGYRTGLFEAAAQGPATSTELADRAGLDERYVREWLGAMVTGGFFAYEPAGGRYSFPAEHAALLTGHAARNLAPMSEIVESFGAVMPELERCFRTGGGVPYAAYRPHSPTAWTTCGGASTTNSSSTASWPRCPA
jgi:hypothetical protein